MVLGCMAARITALALATALALGCTPEQPLTEPEVMTAVSPFEYPVALWDRGIEGETVLMVYVTEMGGVDSVYVHESSGHAAFDDAALVGANKLRFKPARRGEERVARWARLPVRFNLPRGETTGGEKR